MKMSAQKKWHVPHRDRHVIQRINLDIPHDMVEKVDDEAERIGVTRTSLLKLWIAERIDRLQSANKP